MSSRPSGTNSLSNCSKPTSTRAPTPEASRNISSTNSLSDFEETPQPPADQVASSSQSTPVIIVTDSPTLQSRIPEQVRQRTSTYEATQRKGSQRQQAFRTTVTPTMSSASSSPGNTSAAGSSSSSSVQLPYAPFPYPIPANPRGSGQQQGGTKR